MLTAPAPPRPEQLDVHAHACWVSGDDAAQRTRLTRYLAAGLARRERVAFFGHPAERTASVAAGLSDAGVPVGELSAVGQLVFRSAEDEYSPTEAFDPRRRLRSYATAVHTAVNDGFRGLRVAADVAWLSTRPAARRVWPAYELGADLLAAQLPFTALCVYDPRDWQARQLALLESLHSQRIREAPAAADTGFRLHGQPDGSIRLSGELDSTYADQVGEVLRRSAQHSRVAALDVSGLAFVDVAGLRAIATACQTMVDLRGTARVRGGSDVFRRLWRLAAFDGIDPAIVVE